MNVPSYVKLDKKVYVRPVYCFELNETFSSCSDAADHFDVSANVITKCCKGDIHTVRGKYHLCYLDERNEVERERDLKKYGNYKRVRGINLRTGETLLFDSRQEASSVLGIPGSAVSNVISRKMKQTHGWIFEDYEGR